MYTRNGGIRFDAAASDGRSGQPRVRFEYTNWKGHRHTYVADVESFELGPYDEGGIREGRGKQWVMHAMVVTRDEDARPDVNTRRRTFILTKIEKLEEMI
jgi:hypothetical protein